MLVPRLFVVKKGINRVSRLLIRTVPVVKPNRPVSVLTLRVFELLKKAVMLQPKKFYADRNFPKILDAAEITLIFVAEADGHYAGWLAEALLLIHDVVDQARSKFPPGREGDLAFYRWAAQHSISEVSQGES